MAKYCGKLGFADEVQTSPGVYTEQITEKTYYGDVIKNSRSSNSGDSIIPNISINNQFSIIADPFANDNIYKMRYITYMGTKWIISSVEVNYPRLTISVGGRYNENEN